MIIVNFDEEGEKPMYVHFEGLDLAGKTTVCRRFCQQAKGDWMTRHNALNSENPIGQLADELRRGGRYNDETIGWCYHAALLADLETYQKPKVNTLQDSTILLRSLAYHTVSGTPRLVESLLTLMGEHPRFDRSFVCVASKEIRLDRLKRRRPQNLSPEDFIVRDDFGRFKAMEDVLIDYAKRYFDAVIIDTSDLENEESIKFDPLNPKTSLDYILINLKDYFPETV
jgi:thymidylate kinase